MFPEVSPAIPVAKKEVKRVHGVGCVIGTSRGCVIGTSRGCVIGTSRGCVIDTSRGCYCYCC